MRAGRRLVEDFLLPSLNEQRYGDLLKWEDKEKLHFSIRWSHKNAAKWSLNDTRVFQDWDRMKGHFHPEIKGYYMQAKQRFRAALYKLNTVRKLKSEDKHVKKYQLVEKYQLMLENHKNRKEESLDYSGAIKEEPVPADDGKKSIPTSVIRWNDGHVDQAPDQGYKWMPPFVCKKLPELSNVNPSILSTQDSSEEILDYSCHLSPLVQENHVTSAQEQHVQHFVKMEPETSCASSSDSRSLPNGHEKDTSDCVAEDKDDCSLDRSREFFAQLNLMMVDNVRTSKPAESKFVPNKRLCVSPQEHAVPKPADEKLGNNHRHEASNSDAVTEFKCLVAKPLESPFPECEDKKLSKEVTSSGDAVRPSSQSENCVPSMLMTLADSCAFAARLSIEPEPSERKHLKNVSNKSSSSPHVPIPPLPGYSKSSVIPRRTEGQHNTFLIKDHFGGHKTKYDATGNKTTWQKVDPLSCIDGPLNLSTKPDGHYKSESPVLADR